MRRIAGISMALLLSSGLFAQSRGGGFSGATPKVTGSFGSVVFPGGTPATSPGTQRFFGSTIFPGGGGPRLVAPNTRNLTLPPRYGLGTYGAQFGYGIPYFYYGPDTFYQPDQSMAPAQLQQPSQPNVVIVYPQSGQPMTPPAQGDAYWRSYPPAQSPQTGSYMPAPAPSAAAQAQPAAPEPPNYLLAFKDHNIYSAVAYWIDGTTIHYITSGNHHNQASLDLIDRPLTERLSKEAGYEVKLP